MKENRSYLYSNNNGKHLTLDEWISPSNSDSMKDRLTLLTEEENTWYTLAFDKAKVVKRVYFYDAQQGYGSFMMNESYGYDPFREANPDLNDCHGTHFGSSKYLNRKCDEMRKKEKEWEDKHKNLSSKEKYYVRRKDNPYGLEAQGKMTHDYNIKKNGWAFCRTHIGCYYIIEVDLFDGKLLEYPTRITQEEIDNIQKLAPYTRKWTEFGVPTENGDRRYFDKSELPSRAYKSNTSEYKKYKAKTSILKAMEKK